MKRRFLEITGEEFDHFWEMDLPNYIYGEDIAVESPYFQNGACNYCKAHLYDDPFLGTMSAHLKPTDSAILFEYADRLHRHEKKEADYIHCINLLDGFYQVYRKQYTINKTYGFEVQDARLGGLKRRLENCRERLLAYVNGEIEQIEELEETLLPMKDTFITSWAEMVSANVM